jgi:2-polyprenyl-6-methoxyphenol hydroxylase-like FAD-dependent oxidoreductase
VIGGGFGGLLAARVLADHYRQVTVIERDTFPPQGEHRKGVPQSRHTHGLLASADTTAMIGSPAFRDWTDSTDRSFRPLAALA